MDFKGVLKNYFAHMMIIHGVDDSFLYVQQKYYFCREKANIFEQ
jgi:hypothetical protein